MTVSQRDVIFIPHPFSNLRGSKVRPVVVMSNDNYNQNFKDFIGIPLTSNLGYRDYVLRITNNDMEQGSLPKVSNAKVDRIASVQQTLVIAKMGRINKKTFNELRKLLLKVI